MGVRRNSRIVVTTHLAAISDIVRNGIWRSPTQPAPGSTTATAVSLAPRQVHEHKDCTCLRDEAISARAGQYAATGSFRRIRRLVTFRDIRPLVGISPYIVNTSETLRHGAQKPRPSCSKWWWHAAVVPSAWAAKLFTGRDALRKDDDL